MADPALDTSVSVVIEDENNSTRTDFDIGIYRLEFPDGRFYIGSSSKLRVRFLEHRSRLRKGSHSNPRIQRAWDKYKSIVFRTLLICQEDDLLFYEQLCMDRLGPGLNLSFIAGRVSWSAESRAKLSKTLKGSKHTDEAKAKISKAKKGVSTGPQSAATRQKRSLSMMGNKHGLGKRMSEKNKARLAISMRGNTFRCGIKLSEDHRRKITESLRGNAHTLGRKRPEEEKLAISRKMKQIWAQKLALSDQSHGIT